MIQIVPGALVGSERNSYVMPDERPYLLYGAPQRRTDRCTDIRAKSVADPRPVAGPDLRLGPAIG